MVQPIQRIWNPNTQQWEQIAPTKEEFDGLAGTGRTTETVKGNKDQIDVLSQNVNSHLSDYVLQVPYVVSTGSANSYSVLLNGVTSYVEGMAVAVKINVNNTGASTINVNGLGAKTIKKPNGNDVSAGNLKAGSIYSMRYNGTNFILQGSDAAGDATPGDVLSGKTFSNDEGEQVGTLALTGNAVATDVLSGKTFYNTNAKSKVTGSMTNRGAVTITPGMTDQPIPAGYHNGSGKVKAKYSIRPSNTLQISSDTSKNITSLKTPVKLKEIKIGKSGGCKVSFTLNADSESVVCAQIYINGSPSVGVDCKARSYESITFSQYIAVRPGDKIQIYGYRESSSYTGRVGNFRIYYDVEDNTAYTDDEVLLS